LTIIPSQIGEPIMSLLQRLAELISACFTGLWVQSFERQDALEEIARLCRQENWRLAIWDVHQGLRMPDQAIDAGVSDPLAAIRSLNALASADSSAILVLVNFHRFLQSAEIVQALEQQILAGKSNRTFLLILSPVVQLPCELERTFSVVEHELPDRPQLEAIARGIAVQEGELPEGDDLQGLLDAACGMTRCEAENAFSLSLVRHRRLEASTIWQLKAAELKKSNLLSLYRGGETFADLGGLESLKGFCRRALRPRSADKPKARGIVLLGPPGTGKSAVAKALGSETGRPTLILDPGSLLGSLVGQTEERTRQALRIIDAFGPCVVVIDEVDHALAGHNSSGDSGVMSRFFGQMQTWLNDHTSDAFVVCTSNDIRTLPAAFTRAERFDGLFYVGLPGVSQRRAIWRIYCEKYGLDPSQPKPVDADFSGAEIKACCRLAALLDVSLIEAAQNVVPVARTAHESVEQLRKWASGRCLSADVPGIYHVNGSEACKKPSRKVRRDPSAN
jgi:hypothetical protein